MDKGTASFVRNGLIDAPVVDLGRKYGGKHISTEKNDREEKKMILEQVFKIVYVSPIRGHEDPYSLPDTAEYGKIRDRVKEMVDAVKDVPFEPAYVRAFDGVTLFGRFFEGNPGAPLIIAFHGYASSAYRDCAPAIRLRNELGYSVLIVDQRGQGKSGGRCMTFGANESRDVITWCSYAKERLGDDVRIGLCGVSMGAATIVLAAERPDLPDNVKGVFADCPFSSGEKIIKSVMIQRKVPPQPFFRPVRAAGERYGGFLMEDTDCLKGAKNIKVPIFLIHGEADDFVPCYMSRQIAEAAPDMVTLSTYAGAMHGASYMADRKRYEEENSQFWLKIFGKE